MFPLPAAITANMTLDAVLAPLSALWDNEPTVLWNDSAPATWETIERGLRFWEALLGDSGAADPSK